jgi:hypothetical protein
MSKLKQEVSLEVWDSEVGGKLVLDATGLRTDFDIRHIPGLSRAKFVIYNLTEKAVQNMMSGDRYVTLKTTLHGDTSYTLARRFRLSNAVDELKLPNRLTTLYCFDTLRITLLEQEVNETVIKPTLRRIVNQSCDALGFAGARVFKSFPEGLLDEPGLKQQRPVQGTIEEVLTALGKEFNFLTYTVDGNLVFMYQPDIDNVDKTELATREADIVFHTRAMRSNPKIGLVTCKIHSNLDGRIKPSDLIDLSQLLTVSADESDLFSLEAIKGYAKNFSDNSKYQAFAIQHKGSNYTEEWSTIVSGLSPTKGKLMDSVSWAK